MAKFKSKKEQLETAHNLLKKLSIKNTGGVTPLIKDMIMSSYLLRVR